MAVSDVDRESVLAALKNFDTSLRSAPHWLDWERRYDYAIEVGDHLYPAKEILSMASGLSTKEFSGGDQTNRPLVNLGFRIVDLSNLRTPTLSDGEIGKSLKKLLRLYAEVRRTKPYGTDSELWGTFDKVRRLFTLSQAIRTRPPVKVKWSVGKGVWAQIPWIAFLDSRITNSTTAGVYAVFLFREDMSGIYATLNQGVTQATEERGQSAGREWLRDNSARLREFCGHLSQLGFALDGRIDLKAGSLRAQNYESATIAHKFYPVESIPADSEILTDLEGLLHASDNCIDHIGAPSQTSSLNSSQVPREHRAWIWEIIGTFGGRELRTLTRDELQDFLDSKSSLSFSIVDHLRWDLRQIFQMAVAEGIVVRNPALMLFTPRQSRKPNHCTMTVEEVKRALAALDLRERLIVRLAIYAGLRPGEIFGLRRGRVTAHAVDIQERVYRGRLDTPKTSKSVRFVALSTSVRADLQDWLAGSPDGGPDAWLFPSEKLSTPLSKENAMYRYIRKRLQEVGLGWVNFQVMRRTYASIMRERGVDPKVVADLMGHDVDVNLNVYTQTSQDSQRKAVEALDSAFVN